MLCRHVQSMHCWTDQASDEFCAGGYNRERAIVHLMHNPNDLMSFGRHYLANPDLPKRYRLNAKLNPYKREFFYCLGDEGYLDYPFLDETD